MRSDVVAHVCEHGDEEWIIGWSEHLAGGGSRTTPRGPVLCV